MQSSTNAKNEKESKSWMNKEISFIGIHTHLKSFLSSTMTSFPTRDLKKE